MKRKKIQKISIIGCPGAGKSTLASRLSALLGLPVVHLDQIYHDPAHPYVDRPLWDTRIDEIVARPSWIIDGVHPSTYERRTTSADLTIFLDFSVWVCLKHILKRWQSGRYTQRPDMPEGFRDKLKLTFLLFVLLYRLKERPLVYQAIKQYAQGRNVVVLKNPKQVAHFLGGDLLSQSYLPAAADQAGSKLSSNLFFKLRSAYRALSDQLNMAIVRFKTDSLFRNAVYLMSSTAVMGALGLGFWIFLARYYQAADIGAASALISITLLIGNLSSLGLADGIVRFLSKSKTPAGDINASMLLVTASSIIATVIYLMVAGHALPGQLGLFARGWGAALLVFLMAAVSLNTFTDSIFIARRRVEFHTIVYACFGVVKLVLPIFLISQKSLGIVLAYSVAVVISLLLSLVFMARYCSYRLFARPNWQFIRQSARYSSNNYVASLFAGVPAQVLPSLVLAKLGGASAAYYSIAWAMASLLFVAPSAITKSLLAEGAHDASMRSHDLKKAIRLMAVLVTPAVVLSVVAAPYLLRLFGKEYANGSTTIFQLLALCTFLYAGNSVGQTIMNLEHRSRGVVFVQAVIAIAILGLTWTMMSLGLVGVGLAMLGAYLIGDVAQVVLLMRRRAADRQLHALNLAS